MTQARKNSPIETRHSNRAAMAGVVAAEIVDRLQIGLQRTGHASLVVPGGSTPKQIFSELRQQVMPWSRVTVTLSDERWVATTHPDSNQQQVCTNLLQDEAAHAQIVGLMSDGATPEQGIERCNARLARLPRPFDAVMLGMGADGHTASLFPGSEALAIGLDPATGSDCVADHPTDAPHARLSLTLRALLDSRQILLCLFGEEKWRVYQTAREADPRKLPVAALLQQDRVPVAVHWAP